jgi:hypothetical protein
VAKYFLHLRDDVDELLDPEGVDCADLDDLQALVMRNARDLIAGDVLHGTIDLRYRIDAETGTGVIAHSLAFTEAVTVLGPD